MKYQHTCLKRWGINELYEVETYGIKDTLGVHLESFKEDLLEHILTDEDVL